MRPKRASILELPARWGQPEAQLALVRDAVGRGETDLVVLPEASLTGYVSETLSCDLTHLAESLAAGTERLGRLAEALSCDVVGPVVELDGSAAYNAMVGVSPDGQRWLHYRKRHPWFPETWASPGSAGYPLVPWRGLQVTAAICFDLHFLEAEAAEVLEAADVLLFPSAWVDGGETRGPMLLSLARRYGLLVLNANWGLGRPRLRGQGGSMAIWPDGTTVVGTGLRLDVALDETPA